MAFHRSRCGPRMSPVFACRPGCAAVAWEQLRHSGASCWKQNSAWWKPCRALGDEHWDMEVSWNRGTTKSSIYYRMWCSIIKIGILYSALLNWDMRLSQHFPIYPINYLVDYPIWNIAIGFMEYPIHMGLLKYIIYNTWDIWWWIWDKRDIYGVYI